jgi:hypothetical protein
VLRDLAQDGVVPQGIAHKICELRQCLDTGVPGTDEHEGELASLVLFGGCGGCGLQSAQHVGPQVDRVRERLEAKRVLREAGDGQRPRNGAERDDEVRVPDLDDVFLGLHGCLPSIGVYRSRATEEQLRVRAHHPERNHDVAWLEGAGSCLGQHRRVQHEVLGRDDRRAVLAEEACHVTAREATAQHERSTHCGAICHEPTLRRELDSTVFSARRSPRDAPTGTDAPARSW